MAKSTREQVCIWGWDNLLEITLLHFNITLKDLPWLSWRIADRLMKILFWKYKKPVRQIFLPWNCSFLVILHKKPTLSDHGLRMWAWRSLNFIYFCCLHYEYKGKFQKVPKVPLHEYFCHFAKFVQKPNFEWSHFKIWLGATQVLLIRIFFIAAIRVKLF